MEALHSVNSFWGEGTTMFLVVPVIRSAFRLAATPKQSDEAGMLLVLRAVRAEDVARDHRRAALPAEQAVCQPCVVA